MKAIVTIGETNWDSSHDNDNSAPHLKRLKAAFLEHFATYSPKETSGVSGTYNYPTFEMEKSTDDAEFDRLLDTFDVLLKAVNPAGAAALFYHPTAAETKQSRFLLPYFLGDYVDETSSRQLLNPEMESCAQCRFPRFDSTPNPLRVNGSVLKKFDIFDTVVGFIVVRERVLNLLKKALGDQINSGDVELAKASVKLQPGERFFWVKPTQSLGSRVRVVDGQKVCADCKRSVNRWLGPLDFQVKKLGPGLVDASVRVTDFGKATGEIAWIDNSATGNWPKLVMSGALLAHLEADGVKGIAAYTKHLEARVVFSDKGEPPLRAKPATFGDAPASAKSVKIVKGKGSPSNAKAAMEEHKNLPWDCDVDGHIYFQLSGPEFVVFDPMIAEQSTDEPFRVKHFKGPGIYRLPVAAIKTAKKSKQAVAVDSGFLIFVDGDFLAELFKNYAWEEAIQKNGTPDLKYHQRIAKETGTRFGICSAPPPRFKSEFKGDGFYTIDASKAERVGT